MDTASKDDKRPTKAKANLKRTWCKVHGYDCSGDDGGFLFDGNHPEYFLAVPPIGGSNKK